MGQLWAWHCSLPSLGHTSLKTENTDWATLVRLLQCTLTSFFLPPTSQDHDCSKKQEREDSLFVDTHICIERSNLILPIVNKFFSAKKGSSGSLRIKQGACLDMKQSECWSQNQHYIAPAAV